MYYAVAMPWGNGWSRPRTMLFQKLVPEIQTKMGKNGLSGGVQQILRFYCVPKQLNEYKEFVDRFKPFK